MIKKDIISLIQKDRYYIHTLGKINKEEQLQVAVANPDGFLLHYKNGCSKAKILAIKELEKHYVCSIIKNNPTHQQEVWDYIIRTIPALLMYNPNITKKQYQYVKKKNVNNIDYLPTKNKYNINLNTDNIDLTISNQSRIDAVKKNGFLIGLIKDPTHTEYVIAAKQSPILYDHCKSHIKKRCKTTALNIIAENFWFLEKITNPTRKEIMHCCIMNNHIYDKYVDTLTDQEKEEVDYSIITRNSNIRNFKTLSYVNKKRAVSINPNNILFIDNPTKELYELALEKRPSLCKYINDIPDSVQVLIVNENPELIQYIKNPCNKAQVIALKFDLTLKNSIQGELTNQAKKTILKSQI